MYNYDKLVKTVVLGDSRVGKSCLILRIADDSYTESEITSIGIDFKIKDIEVENKKVRLQIWDTHRKINFRCPDDVPRQIRGAQAFLVLFDLTDWSSFENAKGIITQIDTSSKNVILVGTKSDLKHKRVVDTDDADNYAKEKHIDYMEVSAKNAYGVNPLSERLAQKALVPEIKESDRLSPEAVTALKESLRRYINRIEAHKITMNVGNASQPKIVTKNDYEYGFWFFAKSRALNREANYLLATKLLEELEKGNISKSLFTQSSLDDNRSDIIGKNKLFASDDFAYRGGINSKELNGIIGFANKP